MSVQPTVVNYCSFVPILEADSSSNILISPLKNGAFIVKEAKVKPSQQKVRPNKRSRETSLLTLTLAEHWKQVTLKALTSLSEVNGRQSDA